MTSDAKNSDWHAFMRMLIDAFYHLPTPLYAFTLVPYYQKVTHAGFTAVTSRRSCRRALLPSAISTASRHTMPRSRATPHCQVRMHCRQFGHGRYMKAQRPVIDDARQAARRRIDSLHYRKNVLGSRHDLASSMPRRAADAILLAGQAIARRRRRWTGHDDIGRAMAPYTRRECARCTRRRRRRQQAVTA